MPPRVEDIQLRVDTIKKLVDPKNERKNLLDYMRNVGKAFTYSKNSLDYMLPSVKESKNLDFQFEMVSQWERFSQLMTGLPPFQRHQILPPIISEILKYPDEIGKAVNSFKNVLKRKYEEHEGENYNPKDSERFSNEWCVTRFFDLARPIVNLNERFVSESTNGSMNITASSSFTSDFDRKLSLIKKNLNVISPIVESSIKGNGALVDDVVACQNRGVYRKIIADEIRASGRGIQTAERVDKAFKNFSKEIINEGKELHTFLSSPVGKAVYLDFVSDNMKVKNSRR